MTAKEVLHILHRSNQFFYVRFTKRGDGTLREMRCRRGVKTYLKGGKPAYDPNEKNLVWVWEPAAVGVNGPKDTGYRSISCEGIKEIRANSRIWVAKDGKLVEVRLR